MNQLVSNDNNGIIENGKKIFSFVDLFAGIGGFRLAFEKLGGTCVFSSEWDRFAQMTYQANFGEVPYGDITKIDTGSIPNHDILLAGFPCQAFSIAGRRMGFDDTRGTLFFEVARILNNKKPSAFLLENVKGLLDHDKGRTIQVILSTLTEIGYSGVKVKVINAKDYGLAQNRERVFIVGFRKETSITDYEFPEATSVRSTIGDILLQENVAAKYYLSQRYLDTLREHRRRHESKGNGFGYEIKDRSDIANALVIGGMGKERNLVIDMPKAALKPTTKIIGEINKEGVRRLTPREWARLQGFPDHFLFPVSDAQAYKQLGNSVAVPAVLCIGIKMIDSLIRAGVIDARS